MMSGSACARLASVSHSTVSRALQNSPLVNAETSEKIRKIARESGYRASAVARGLVTKRTRTIGLVVTTIADPFASEVVNGIEEAANAHGYSVFLADSSADPVREQQMVQSFAERRVDGHGVAQRRVGQDVARGEASLRQVGESAGGAARQVEPDRLAGRG